MSISPATRQRWLIGVLIASLAVNAFIVGATATDFIHVRWPFGHTKGKPPQLRFELAWLRGRLPPDALTKIEAAVMTAEPATVAHIQTLRGLRRELAALIAAPQPDRAAIDAKLVDIRAELSLMQAEVQRASTDALVALPPDVRVKLTEPRDNGVKRK